MPLKYHIEGRDIRFGLYGQDGQLLALHDWDSLSSNEDRRGLAVLYSLLESEKAATVDDFIEVPAAEIAALSSFDAAQIGLPSDLPFRMDIRSDGDLSNPRFRFRIRWVKTNGLPLNLPLETRGAIALVGEMSYRIPDPTFTVLDMIERFNANPPSDRDDRMLAWGAIRKALGDESSAFQHDYYLRDTKVFFSNRFTLKIDPLGVDDVRFSPVLITSQSSVEQNSSDFFSEENCSPTLPEKYQDLFEKRFSEFRTARTAYPLDEGAYVVIDPVCRNALAVVRKAMDGTPQERIAFCRNPRAALALTLGDDIPADVLEHLFVETEAFSERVKMIGVWQKKVLPWVQRSGDAWLPPESLGLMLDGKRVVLEQSGLRALKAEISAALASGGGEVVVQGRKIKATEELLSAVQTLIHESEQSSGDVGETPSKDKAIPSCRKVLLIHDNLAVIDYQARQRKHRSLSLELPVQLKTRLKRHQIEGLRWLQELWIHGSPGALLADDMGLGKTLQVLAFLAWIREEMAAGMTAKKPMLIVAPVGLLKNWEHEHRTHLLAPGLGEMVAAYGPGIRNLKMIKSGELQSGQSVLDRGRLQRADWILTSYETLRDYQISFGLIPFSVVVFDEAQKIKTPGALMTEAAKAINSEFTITMTGTPVENRLADLWCIADTAQPGVLGDLKSFSQRYEKNADHEVLGELKNRIWHTPQSQCGPGLMLRRMKEDVLDALPAKHVHSIETIMPEVQANAYKQVVKEAVNRKDPSAMLKVLHQLRSISLHPFIHQASGVVTIEDYIGASARLIATIKLLDQIKSRNEKALIFLESLDMQDSRELPLILKNYYRLPHLPLVINGAVSAPERQKRVERFQNEPGFDVMLLSPRAGGVGLTLTAANHVIHLSRWWNPAVEDQSTDRVYRIGQTKEVHVYYPIAVHPEYKEHSFDFKLHSLIDRKRELSRSLLVPPSITSDEVAAFYSDTVLQQ